MRGVSISGVRNILGEACVGKYKLRRSVDVSAIVADTDDMQNYFLISMLYNFRKGRMDNRQPRTIDTKILWHIHALILLVNTSENKKMTNVTNAFFTLLEVT